MRSTPSQSRSRTGSSSRRPRVPPALTRGPDRFEGLAVLDEVKGDLGLVLWRSVRNLLMWAGTEPQHRRGLFAGGAAAVRAEDLAGAQVDPELMAPLMVIVRLLESPGDADLLRVVNACRRIALWAEHRGALGTALEFTQAAAIAVPESAALAYAVGRLARRRAEYDRAESWYARAVILGRQSKDWKSYSLAFAGMGILHKQRGNYPAAKRAHLRCLRAANRHALNNIRGVAYHDLFALAVEMRAGPEADALAESAFRAYGPKDPRVPRLAYDVAYHWLLQGFFNASLRVGAALLPRMNDASERAALLGLVARAAGGAGRRDAFDTAAAQTDSVIAAGIADETAALTLLGVAHGAASLGEWERAADWAQRALQLAGVRSEGRVALEAEATLDMVTRRQLARRSGKETPVEEPLALAEDFAVALEAASV